MRIDYMKLMKRIRGLFKKYKDCTSNDGSHTVMINGIVNKGKLVRIEVTCNQCDYKRVYK